MVTMMRMKEICGLRQWLYMVTVAWGFLSHSLFSLRSTSVPVLLPFILFLLFFCVHVSQLCCLPASQPASLLRLLRVALCARLSCLQFQSVRRQAAGGQVGDVPVRLVGGVGGGWPAKMSRSAFYNNPVSSYNQNCTYFINNTPNPPHQPMPLP